VTFQSNSIHRGSRPAGSVAHSRSFKIPPRPSVPDLSRDYGLRDSAAGHPDSVAAAGQTRSESGSKADVVLKKNLTLAEPVAGV
jgi:hypothetical protein